MGEPVYEAKRIQVKNEFKHTVYYTITQHGEEIESEKLAPQAFKSHNFDEPIDLMRCIELSVDEDVEEVPLPIIIHCHNGTLGLIRIMDKVRAGHMFLYELVGTEGIPD